MENTTNNFEVLYIYFSVYGIHAAGVKICDAAVIEGNIQALLYAKKIWALNPKNIIRPED